MGIQGDDFLKNVQMKQEEENLKQKINQFEDSRQESNNQDLNRAESLYNLHLEPEPTYKKEVDEVNEFLEQNQEDTKKENRKKYTILGLSLALLFVITIVMIRLITSDNDNLNEEQQTIVQEEVLDNKIEQDYQQTVDNSLKKIQEDEAFKMPPEVIDEALQVEEVNPSPPSATVIEEKIEVVEPTAPTTIVEEKAEVVVPTPTTPKVVTEPKKVEDLFNKANKGFYIQIGAFSRTPNDKYFKDITQKGLSYKLHQIDVKGKKVIKVLVGPYTTRNMARNELNSVKNLTKVPNAYILEVE